MEDTFLEAVDRAIAAVEEGAIAEVELTYGKDADGDADIAVVVRRDSDSSAIEGAIEDGVGSALEVPAGSGFGPPVGDGEQLMGGADR